MDNTKDFSGSKKTFALVLKNDVKVKTLEDLREYFDLEKVVNYFKSGDLLEWLEDRFYDDEAEAIEKISADDKNLSQKICAALGAECDEDFEFTKRIRVKKKILMELTDDENIIDNAMTTALNQDDLANLLHLDYSTIFLCGENFTVPIRVENKKYIGVLSTPKIKIRADSDEELAAKNISFENCKLAWRKETPMEALKALAQKIFGTKGEWPIFDKNNKVVSSYDKLNNAEKIMAVDLCCQRKYKESDVVFMMIRDDFSDGFALTTDAFCTGGASEGYTVKYNEIGDVDGDWRLYIDNQKKGEWREFSTGTMFDDNNALSVKVKKFLDVVKNF